MTRVLDDDACIVAKERHVDAQCAVRGTRPWTDDEGRAVGFAVHDKAPSAARRDVYEALIAELESRGCSVVEGEHPDDDDAPDRGHTMVFVVTSEDPAQADGDELFARVHMQNAFIAPAPT